MRFLLLTSGDVERNPGPPESDKNKCPCEEEINRRNVLLLACAKCNQKWHLQCVGLEDITEKGILKKLKNWNCFFCYEPPQKVKDKQLAEKQENEEIDEENPIKGIYRKMNEMSEKITLLSKKVEDKGEEKTTYSKVASRQLGNNLNKLVHQLNQEKIESHGEDEKVKQGRTIVVKRYENKNIRNSGDVRKEVNKEFPGSVIRNARTTAGGSIILEFDDADTANKVVANWKETMFGGNKGVMKGNKPRTAGIIKHVYTDNSEEEIKQQINGKYPNSKVELFKKENRFTGVIKVSFDSEEELKDAIDNRIAIGRQRYMVETYIFKPRVIKCNYCQKFSHVSRLCRSQHPVCGKCKSNQHETESCTAHSDDYSCYHCDGNHQTGDKECTVMKEKEEAIRHRLHNV